MCRASGSTGTWGIAADRVVLATPHSGGLGVAQHARRPLGEDFGHVRGGRDTRGRQRARHAHRQEVVCRWRERARRRWWRQGQPNEAGLRGGGGERPGSRVGADNRRMRVSQRAGRRRRKQHLPASSELPLCLALLRDRRPRRRRCQRDRFLLDASKRGVHGVYHSMSRKARDRYACKSAGRLNLRALDTVDMMAAIAAGLAGQPLRYAELTG